METIHLKTVDPISQQLLCSAAQLGIELPWERHEKLQPQDGFLRLGLSCPFGCLQGPCRIDPFGRGPEKGVCGLSRDQMVAGMILRLCQQGALSALASTQNYDSSFNKDFSPSLGGIVNKTLAKHGQPDLSNDDILKSNIMLNRSSHTPEEVILQALRLALLTLGFLEQNAEEKGFKLVPGRFGYGTISGSMTCIGFSGQPSPAVVAALVEKNKNESKVPVEFVSLGEWIFLEDQFMPIACTSGESELLVSSGAIHLLIAGTTTDPGLVNLCRQMSIPVVAETETIDAGDIISLALKRAEAQPQQNLLTDNSPVQEDQVLMPGREVAQLFTKNRGEKIALLGGSDTPQMSLGYIPIELATNLAENGLYLAGWGDAALWLLKARTLSKEKNIPFKILENRQGPLMVVKALAAAGKLDQLQGICFTGVRSCQEFTMAMGLAFSGCRVSVATPIPILGSPSVCDGLANILGHNGGQLLYFDHPPLVGELSEWFTDQK